MTTFRNDPDYRKLLRVYRSCFQEIHEQVQKIDEQFLQGKPLNVDPKSYRMNALCSALVQAGIKFEKVGDYKDKPFSDESGEGFFLVEGKFLVGTAFLQLLSDDEIRVYLYDRSWTGMHVVLLNFQSEQPDWYSLDKSWPEPTFIETMRERVKDLDEPDEYWLYMSDPEAYDRRLDDDPEEKLTPKEYRALKKKKDKTDKDTLPLHVGF